METVALREAAQAQIEDYLSDLALLVNTDSGTYTPHGVAQVADALHERFASAGALVERVPGKLHDGRLHGPHLVARWPGAGRGRILLVGHMDTVFPEGGAARRPFRVEGDRAYGPGVMDMKSGLLVGLYAARLLQAGDAQAPWAELVMLCNSDEEVGSPTSHDLVAQLASQSDATLVLEPNSRLERVTVARKGVATFRLDVTGIASHAGVEPDKGSNAIVELALRTLAIHAFNGAIPGVTLNVGVIAGGERPNIVADHAHALIDVRAPDPEAVAAVEAEMRYIAATEATIEGTQTRLSGGFVHQPFTQSAASQRLFAQADAVAQELGFALVGRATGGGSDGNTAAAIGAATLDGLGPVGGHAHNPGEYIEVASVAPRIALLAGLLQRIAADRA